MDPVVLGTLEALSRMEAFARHAAGAPPADAARIGAHLRHALEHVTLLLDGLEAATVDYSARAREAALESPLAIAAALPPLRARVARLEPASLRASLDVVDVVAPGRRGRVPSSVARELHFAASHAIHHLALAARYLEDSGHPAPASLITAYSTQEHARLGVAS